MLHYPVQLWVMLHPFTSYNAFKISSAVQIIAEETIKDTTLDGDYAGGQVDAFRHGLWMSSLTQKIGARRARSLGKAYEKSNEIDYHKGELEDNFLPDYMSSQMDLKNNEVGILVGKENKKLPQKKLISLIKSKVLEGKFYKIKKNCEGKFLSKDNRVLKDEEYKGHWYSPKTLVKSNYKCDKLKYTNK